MTFYTWTVDADLARQLHRGDSESEFSQIDLDKLRFKAFAECKKKAQSSRTHTHKKNKMQNVSATVFFSHTSRFILICLASALVPEDTLLVTYARGTAKFVRCIYLLRGAVGSCCRASAWEPERFLARISTVAFWLEK